MADEGEDWDNYAPGSTPPPTQTYSQSYERNDRGRRNNDRDGWQDDRKGRGRGFVPSRRDRNDGNDTRQDGQRNWRNGDSGPRGDVTIIQVSSSDVGRVIGRAGAKIREIENESGAKVKVNKPDDMEPWITKIELSGSADAVASAQELIEIATGQKMSQAKPVKEEEFVQIDWAALKIQSEEAQKAKWAKAPPMIKNFYFEDPQVKNMDPAFAAEFRKKKNNIVVKNVFDEHGGHIPNPVTNFEQAFRDYPEIMGEIEKNGFKEPSPIQCQAWPVLLGGRDLIGIAQTGTGKTLAFLLPALIHIDGQPVPREERIGPNVLIIAPTRELAQQIEEEVTKYSYRNIKSCCVYGGGNRRDQVNKVTSGVEIVIATAGRLNDLVNEGIIELSAVTYLVLDEADRMLDMGFEPQIRKVLLDIRPDRQSVMTSATWPPGVRELAERYMKNPVQVFVGSLDLAAVHSVSQQILICNKEEKRDYLEDFLKSLTPEDKVIIFVGRKVMADHISSDLGFQGVVVQSIHGDRAQEDREQALKDLKSGEVRILIATDVASRGLDITDITKVFNYDFPRNIEEYVHRVGRTGRAGRTGEAISLFTREDWGQAGELIEILTEAKQLVPEELYGMKDRFSAMKAKKAEEREYVKGEMRHSDGFGGGGRREGGFGGGGRGRRGGGGGFGGGGGGGGYGGGGGRYGGRY